jgi:hypothetical protein
MYRYGWHLCPCALVPLFSCVLMPYALVLLCSYALCSYALMPCASFGSAQDMLMPLCSFFSFFLPFPTIANIIIPTSGINILD